jgi:RNA polymerase sigma-70 factor (ECF subfamily)
MAADALEMVSVDGPARQVETRLAVEAVLASLAPELRAVLVLRELEQLDYEEIAETLEIPIGTVRSRLFKARERFRQGWTDMEGAQ